MKIIATRKRDGIGTETYELLGTGRSGGGYVTITPTQSIQIAMGCRWREAKSFDRGNIQHLIRFTTHRSFPNYDDALNERMKIMARYVGNWDVLFYTGNMSRLFWFKDAVITPIPEVQTGIDCIVHWEIRGGRIRESLSDKS